jgi:hypothetical protein
VAYNECKDVKELFRLWRYSAREHPPRFLFRLSRDMWLGSDCRYAINDPFERVRSGRPALRFLVNAREKGIVEPCKGSIRRRISFGFDWLNRLALSLPDVMLVKTFNVHQFCFSIPRSRKRKAKPGPVVPSKVSAAKDDELLLNFVTIFGERLRIESLSF